MLLVLELCKVPSRNNHNEAITHLAMPERAIPVLVKCPTGLPDGFIPDDGQTGGVVAVRRLSPSLVERLTTNEEWRQVEKEYGDISQTEWIKLRDLLALIERLSAGDGSSVVTFDESEVEALGRLLKRLSPGGWYRHNGPKGARYRSISGDVQFEITPEAITVRPIGDTSSESATLSRRQERQDSRNLSIHAIAKTPALFISEALTRGLRDAKLVIWWARMERKLAPGLFCPDIMTALYTLLLSSIGCPGGIAVCQRCRTPFIRSKGIQLYCGHRCQVAAGMKRYRSNLKRQAARKPKAKTKSKKPISKE
jgi:hypothetical protein